MPQNNTPKGSLLAMFLLVSFHGFPWIYQVADRDETRLTSLGDYKGFGPLSEDCAKSPSFAQISLPLYHFFHIYKVSPNSKILLYTKF